MNKLLTEINKYNLIKIKPRGGIMKEDLDTSKRRVENSMIDNTVGTAITDCWHWPRDAAEKKRVVNRVRNLCRGLPAKHLGKIVDEIVACDERPSSFTGAISSFIEKTRQYEPPPMTYEPTEYSKEEMAEALAELRSYKRKDGSYV